MLALVLTATPIATLIVADGIVKQERSFEGFWPRVSTVMVLLSVDLRRPFIAIKVRSREFPG
jgi:hypothetical protein